MRSDCHLERNRLMGAASSVLNVLFSAATMNFAKLLRFVLAFCSLLFAAFFQPMSLACFA